MFAIIRTGGKQYKVVEGQEILIERLDLAPETVFNFDDVLLVGGKSTAVGKPHVGGASVAAKIIGEEKADKVISIRYKAKKDVHKVKGHRQIHTRVMITKIVLKDDKPAQKKPEKAEAVNK
jgi:large subunit ribosomal protein L21